MDDLISKLSEIRSDYNCFSADEEPYYRALSEAIRILSQLADGDTISRQAAINALCFVDEYNARSVNAIKNLPSAQPELIAQDAYVRGFEQGRTQGMIDSQGGKK